MKLNELCMGCMGKNGGNKICPICEWNEELVYENPVHLLPDTLINDKYLVGKVLEKDDFSITYLGWDKVLSKKIAIKEYLPQQFSTRNVGEENVTIFETDEQQYFQKGLEKFLEEAEVLAKFGEHQNIVSVYDFLKLNNTAYIVTNYEDGITVKEYLHLHDEKIPYTEALEIIAPVMKALEAVHEVNILHRDINPENIYMCKDGQIKLLDFGFSMLVGDDIKNSSVKFNLGFAPEEQYKSEGVQGPWTDVYALAATFYRMLVGEAPPESLKRLEEDTINFTNEFLKAVPEEALNCLKIALSVKPEDRYQSIKDFSIELFKNDNMNSIIQDSLEDIKLEVEVIASEISGGEEQIHVESIIESSLIPEDVEGDEVVLPSISEDVTASNNSNEISETEIPQIEISQTESITKLDQPVYSKTNESKVTFESGVENGSNKKNRYIIVATLALVLVIVIGIGSILFIKPMFFSKSNTKSETTATTTTEIASEKAVTTATVATATEASKQAEINITQVNTDNFPQIKVYFSVLDEQKKELPSLNTKHFKIGEKLGNKDYNSDIIISNLRELNNNDDINLNLVMDNSINMEGDKLQQAKTAASNFINNANYSSGDKIEIISFNDLVNINEPFSNDKTNLKKAIDKLYTNGQSAFYDSLNSALIETNKQTGHKCIVAFTAGEDNKSKYSKDAIIELSKQLSIPIYVIGIGKDVKADILTDLTTKTGGYYKSVTDIKDIEGIYKDIFSNQKIQYELTYTTPNYEVSSDWRSLNLNVEGNGYIAKVNTQFMPSKAVKSVNRRGNTNGNIVNLGLVTKQDEWTYYAGWSDTNFGICKIKADGAGWIKLTNDKARSLNVIGDWIYYENISDSEEYTYNNKKVTSGKMYKIKTDGSDRQLIKDKNNQYFLPGVISIIDDFIYITNRKDNESLYRIKISDNQSEKLNSNFSWNINVVGNYIYYGNMSDGDKIYRLDLSNKEDKKIVSINSRSINATENGMFYVDMSDKETINRLEYNNSATKLGMNAWPINVNGNYIYYCSDSKLWKIDVNGGNPIKILDVHTSFINIIENWVYYINDSDGKLYRVDASGYNNQLVKF